MQVGNLYTLRVPRRTKIERKTKGKIGREEEVGKTGETRKKRRKTVCGH